MGNDPSQTRAGDLGEGKPVTIGADDSAEEALQVMSQHKVRRLPIIDGHDLVGVISMADVATNLDEQQVGDPDAWHVIKTGVKQKLAEFLPTPSARKDELQRHRAHDDD